MFTGWQELYKGSTRPWCQEPPQPSATGLSSGQPESPSLACYTARRWVCGAGRQTYVSPEADRALCRAQGGNNSQGAIYRVQVRSPRPCLALGQAQQGRVG